ncbi:histidine kinase [Desulfovibrio sp. X2]|uniref:response regulator n=1 Tax=Desulfovibrio sp. X2 TaxID=941449 RepID=UPI0003587BAD|nr:response regulator [Desulfovibrio sp. X2]EPR41087.1 histidine kinase [Desulfovibrio sp. X2]
MPALDETLYARFFLLDARDLTILRAGGGVSSPAPAGPPADSSEESIDDMLVELPLWRLVPDMGEQGLRAALAPLLEGRAREVSFSLTLHMPEPETPAEETEPARALAWALDDAFPGAPPRILLAVWRPGGAPRPGPDANATQSTFLAGLSHEVRTPLTGLLGLGQLLLETRLEPEQRSYVRHMLGAARGLMRIVDDALDVAAMEAGRLSLQDRPYSPAEMVHDVAGLFSGQASAKGLTLAASASSDLPGLVHGDGGRVRQVLHNLVGNAVKFTAEGGVEVEADVLPSGSGPPDGRADGRADGRTDGRADGQAGGERRLHFVVRDTGPGIPEVLQAAVFEPFYQIKGQITGQIEGQTGGQGAQARPAPSAPPQSDFQSKGTGLGLAICKGLVERMGGVIRLESAVGRGSAFHVELPLREDAYGAPFGPEPFTLRDGAQAASCGAAAESLAGRALRVLVVDDNRVNVLVTRGLLQRMGYTALGALSGEEALEILSGEPVDVVLMDISMPGMDGLECLQRLREGGAGEANRGVPVVAVTAHAMKGDRERFLGLGMNGYLAKPFEAGDLAEAVRGVLGDNSDDPARGAAPQPDAEDKG